MRKIAPPEREGATPGANCPGSTSNTNTGSSSSCTPTPTTASSHHSGPSLSRLVLAAVVAVLIMVFSGLVSVSLITKQAELAKAQAVVDGGGSAAGPPAAAVVTDAPAHVEGTSLFLDSHHGGGGSSSGLAATKPIRVLVQGGLFGKKEVPPLQSGPWCEAELQSTVFIKENTQTFSRHKASKDAAMDKSSPASAEDPMSPAGTSGESCVLDRPARQGNFTTLSDITRFSRFPRVDVASELSAVSSPRLAAYWKDYPYALDPKCASCRGSLTQDALYTLRRWFRLHLFVKKGRHTRLDVLVIAEDGLQLFQLAADVFGRSPDPDTQPEDSIPFARITTLSLLPSARPGAYYLVVNGGGGAAKSTNGNDGSAHGEGRHGVRKEGEGVPPLADRSPSADVGAMGAAPTGEGTVIATAELSAPAALSLLRSMTVLVPTMRPKLRVAPGSFAGSIGGGDGARSGAATAAGGPPPPPSPQLPPSTHSGAVEVATRAAHRWPAANLSLLAPGPWPYQPCHKFDQVRLHKEATLYNNFDRYRLFWPFTCDALREAPCGYRQQAGPLGPVNATPPGIGQRPKISVRGSGVPVRVAVALSGFVRSFGRARLALWERIVAPLQATVFISTWNVMGRTKKGEPIPKKQILRPERVRDELAQWIMLPPDVNASQHIDVLDYRAYTWAMERLRRDGFPHGGLYLLMARALDLVEAFEFPFEVIIRTRMDIVPFAPIQIERLPTPTTTDARTHRETPSTSNQSFVVTFGASCSQQGAWWPQRAIIFDGKVLKPTPDTRFKFFGWQVCDWMEIGTRSTMKKVARTLDYVQEHYIFSSAQWVDHAYAIHAQIAYQPVQMFLKIMRHSHKFFG